jgi:tetratricopeptide (TPR) repeat protein
MRSHPTDERLTLATADDALITPTIIITSYAQSASGDGIKMGPVGERYDRGVALKVTGNYEDAIVEFQAILSVYPEHIDAHRQLGLVYGFLGQFDESIRELLEAVSLNGGDVNARNDLALTYAMIGLFEEAQSEFLAVLSDDPDNAVAKKNLTYF